MTFHIYNRAGTYIGVAAGLNETEALLRAFELYECDPSACFAFPYFLGHSVRV